MTQFRISAISSAGIKEEFSVDAASEMDAARVSIERGLVPLAIRARGTSLFETLNRPVFGGRSLSTSQLAQLTEHLAAMLAAGMPLGQALAIVGRGVGQGAVNKVATKLLSRVQEGASLSDALQELPDVPGYYVGIVRAAERGGRLVEALTDLASELQHNIATRNAVINALLYPIVVVATTVAALLFVFTFVIPEFEPIFAGEERRLPWITRTVLWVSDVFNNHSHAVLLTTVSVTAAICFEFRTPAGPRHAWTERVLSRIPFVQLKRRNDVARVLRVLGTLLVNGVELSEALSHCARSTSSGLLRGGLEQAARRLREGLALSNALAETVEIPETSLCLINLGEQTGTLGPSAIRAAGLLDADTRLRIDRLVTLLNPLAIITLGGIIAVVIAGVMLGILSINQLALRG